MCDLVMYNKQKIFQYLHYRNNLYFKDIFLNKIMSNKNNNKISNQRMCLSRRLLYTVLFRNDQDAMKYPSKSELIHFQKRTYFFIPQKKQITISKEKKTRAITQVRSGDFLCFKNIICIYLILHSTHLPFHIFLRKLYSRDKLLNIYITFLVRKLPSRFKVCGSIRFYLWGVARKKMGIFPARNLDGFLIRHFGRRRVLVFER